VQSIEQELQQNIEEAAAAFQKFPWEDKSAYINWLSQTYFYVRHTTCFLALTASRWGVENRSMQYRALAHLKEELSHDLLILEDLKALGVSIETQQEWPETQAFYQTQYYWIEHVTPAAHLGYAYVLEGMAAHKAADAYKRVIKAHGEKAGKFLRVHAEEDPHHVEEGFKTLKQLSEKEIESFRQCMKQTTLLYKQILNKAKG